LYFCGNITKLETVEEEEPGRYSISNDSTSGIPVAEPNSEHEVSC
ncbi:11437_t:CDS:2, partial [Dentiscutata erythropus]